MITYIPRKAVLNNTALPVKFNAALKIICCLACFVLPGKLMAGTLVSKLQEKIIADTTADSTLFKTRLINNAFDYIYNQNLRLSEGGNDYFNKVKTQLTADLAPNFVLFSTPKSRFFAVFTPRVKIRLLASRGAPVKSPSFMPGATVFFRVNEDTYNPKFFSFGYSHHSNGVRGPSLNPDGSFNRDSGKFTTNFYTLTYYTGKRIDKDGLIIQRYDNLGLEVHAGLFGLGVSEGLKDHYGFIRINGSRMYNLAKAYDDPLEKGKKTYKNWQRIRFDFTYIADKYNNYSAVDFKKRLNVSLKYYYQFPFMPSAALMFGGGYRGQDDYNQFFEDSYGYITVGLASSLSFDFHRH
ncbi:hypothetical protein SNE25_01565 [Mucilaginibacter sabulilitoris]|uniref:Phosphatidylcholine 1-acylhydrolase n=1 Tax=Mucilaginibacter sabulilitoris TaxID=1173583 RepID=A0ABZ0TM21_9SPHI|nr:hypothetical protein [Mucilaginibacter sabulilitoris]WPU94211.1 hypothetical protein SNE25_01565 [Mucilaginibacter sabulilitoris]